MTNTTMGDLVSSLYAKHARRYHDSARAARATHDELATLTGVHRSIGLTEARAAAAIANADAWERA